MLPVQSDPDSGDLKVGPIACSTTGTLQNASTTRSPLSLAQQQLDQAAKYGIQFARILTLDNATGSIRVAVFDCGSNQTGSMTVPTSGHGEARGWQRTDGPVIRSKGQL